jgi:hypothetical protein
MAEWLSEDTAQALVKSIDALSGRLSELAQLLGGEGPVGRLERQVNGPISPLGGLEDIERLLEYVAKKLPIDELQRNETLLAQLRAAIKAMEDHTVKGMREETGQDGAQSHK